MVIKLNDIGKKYGRQWIFRHLDTEINEGDLVAITGHNGSGKSTLLNIIGSYVTPSEGKVMYDDPGQEDLQVDFSFAAPYLNLIEEFTLIEHLIFHARFKKALLNPEEICRQSGLTGSEQKPVSDFSSGMKQRLRLSLSFFYESKMILLDEPTANLDQDGVDWYLKLINHHLMDRTLVIASNQNAEYSFCNRSIKIEQF